MTVTAKITSKGQVTLPRHIREVLTTDTVEIEVLGGNVLLVPVKSVAGLLAQYAGEAKTLSEIREQVWQEVADAKKG